MGFLVGECGKYMGIGRNSQEGYHSDPGKLRIDQMARMGFVCSKSLGRQTGAMEVSSFLASRMARQAGRPKLATDHVQGHGKSKMCIEPFLFRPSL